VSPTCTTGSNADVSVPPPQVPRGSELSLGGRAASAEVPRRPAWPVPTSRARPSAQIAETGGHLVGFVTVRNDEIEQLYVDAHARGSGVAAALLGHGERVIAEQHERAWLAVVAGNTRARRFYARYGWIDTGPFDNPAEIAGGTMTVPTLRYEKRLRPASP
jgi:GNAT superfamily N-acetyltransferase